MAHRWSDGLPSHLLDLILGRLPVDDYIRSGAVCTAWRQAVAENRHSRYRTPESPWLMLGDDKPNTSEFFRLWNQDNKVYRFYLPQIRGMRLLGSSDGWLVARDDFADLHLLNPFTGAASRLPPVDKFSDVTGIECDDNGRITGYMLLALGSLYIRPPMFRDLEFMQKYYYRKVIFLPSMSIAIAIHGIMLSLAFAHVGDESWTEIPVSMPYYFMDVICHRGKFYAVAHTGAVLAFDLGSDGRTPNVTEFTGPSPKLGWNRPYLVGNGADLLLLCRANERVSCLWSCPCEKSLRTTSFEIFWFDMIGRELVRVTSLGKSAVFIGSNHPMSLPVDHLPNLRGNCIYFTEDNNEQFVLRPSARRDIGVFNLEDGSIKPLFPCHSDLNRLTWPPPIWITPTIS